jgi:LysM repeat protein
MKSIVSSRVASFVVATVAAGLLVACSGCGGSKSAAAHSPPPQTLSEPVRVSNTVSAPVEAPAIPVSVRDESAPQKTGESRELPTFLDPQRSAPPAPAPVQRAPIVTEPGPAGSNHYHTLQKGETLSALSRKYNVKVGKIIEANHFKDPNHLAVGTKVYIPN